MHSDQLAINLEGSWDSSKFDNSLGQVKELTENTALTNSFIIQDITQGQPDVRDAWGEVWEGPDTELPCPLPMESGQITSMCSPNRKLLQLWVSRALLAPYYVIGHMTVLSPDPLSS